MAESGIAVSQGTLSKDICVFYYPDCEVVYYDARTAQRRLCCVEFEALVVRMLTPEAVFPEIRLRRPAPVPPTTLDDASLIVTANKGVLTLRSGKTGAAMGTVPLAAMKFGTFPDWSPDGTLLAFSMSASNKDRGISGSSIALADFADGAFKAPRVLVASSGGMDTLSYPSFSADSRWLAYVKETGGSDNNDGARLFLVSVDGKVGPIELTAANSVVSNATVTGNAALLGDTMPTWAPMKTGDLAFLAFSSLRAYGKVYPYKDVKQIWVSAVDLSAAATGKDPSAPAFRLPFQDLKENNHRPFWAEDVLAPPPPLPDGGVGGDGGQCLPLHADCSSGAPCCTGTVCSYDGTKAYTCEIPLG